MVGKLTLCPSTCSKSVYYMLRGGGKNHKGTRTKSGLDNDRVSLSLSLSLFVHTYMHIQRLFCKRNTGGGSPSVPAREVAEVPCLRMK